MAGSTAEMDASLKAAEDDWLNQLKTLEEVDRWEKLANEKTPSEYKEKMTNLTSQFSGLNRIPILKLMGALEWKPEQLFKLFTSTSKLPIDVVLELISLLDSFISFSILLVVIDVVYQLKDTHLMELVMGSTREDIHFIMQVARHLTSVEIQNFVDEMGSVSVKTVINMLKRCDEPMAKSCQLCKQRRLQALEFRMLNHQVPTKMPPVPGNLALLDKSEKWSADDEKLLSFSLDGDQIYFLRQPVDIVQICDKCLMDVNQSVTNMGRFDPFYHIDVSIRKPVMHAARQREKDMAEIIWRIAGERRLRRCREFALRALKSQREGLKKEQQERERLAAEERRQQEILAKQRAHQSLVNAAMQSEEKWNRVEVELADKQLDRRMNYSETQLHMGYGKARPAPKKRQHSRTWRLDNFDEDGIPVTEDGATIAFGQFVEHDYGELPQIKVWKLEVDAKTAIYRARQNEIAEALRAKEIREMIALKDYVNEKSKVSRRRQKQMEHQAEQEEYDRIERRKGERDLRRLAKFEQFLEQERECMLLEDFRSYELRRHLWDVSQQNRERDDMWYAEREQCEVDRFWGLDAYERRQNEEETRLKRLYEAKVIDLNMKLSTMKAVQPITRKNRENKVVIQKITWRDPQLPLIQHSKTSGYSNIDGVRSKSGVDGGDVKMSQTVGGMHSIDMKKLEAAQRMETIRVLKAEEIRGKLKYRLSLMDTL